MHADYIADSLSSVVSHPVTVQVINQGPGIWGSVAAGLITAGAAIAGVMLTHRFTLNREKLAAQDKRQQELHYLASELAFVLERYALAWVPLSWTSLEQFRKGTEQSPVLNLSVLKGDWRTLPARTLFRIRSLEADHEGLISFLSNEHFTGSPHTARNLKVGSFNLALKAFLLAARVRRLSGLPDSLHLKSGTGIFRMLREGRRITRLDLKRQKLVSAGSGSFRDSQKSVDPESQTCNKHGDIKS